MHSYTDHNNLMPACMIHTFTAVEVQGLPYGCQAEIEVDKRDGSGDVDFVVCVKAGMCIVLISYSI